MSSTTNNINGAATVSISYTYILSTLEREGLHNNKKLKTFLTQVTQQEQKSSTIDDYLLNQVHNFLASLFIDANFTYLIARVCKAILPLVVSQLVHQCLASTDQDLHDKVTCALSKILPLFPQFLQFVIMHLKGRPSLLDRIISQKNRDSQYYLELIKTAHRLLNHSPEEFAKMWNWSPFFALLEHPEEQVKWYASKCVSLLLQHEGVEANMLANAKSFNENTKFAIDSNEEEELHLNQFLALYSQSSTATTPSRTLTGEPMDIESSSVVDHHSTTRKESNLMVEVCGVWLPKKIGASNESKISSKLIFTETSIANTRAVAMAVSQGSPVLLEGITGAGKTAIVEELAHMTGNTDLIKVNLDESFDSKDLLGTYVCTDVPGEFKWQPGALTKAVTEGRWILIEDLDLAPFDIVSAIIPLVESNTLFIPSRDEVIPASTGFHLFATQSMVESFNGSASRQRVLAMSNLWNQVRIEKLSSSEIEIVLQTKFPAIAHLTPNFLDTYETLRGTKETLPIDSVGETNEIMEEEEKNRSKDFAQLRSFGRLFSFRDLLKWCERINRFYGHKINKDYLVSQIKKDIFHEAVDIFCGMIVKKNVYNAVVHTIAHVWGITDFSHYLELYKPQVVEGAGSVTVGRITMGRDKKGLAENLADVRKFAHTKASLRLMERCAACVQMKEPVLLTGETGTGKTSIVQHLATLIGKKLIVHNLNQQTDSADFIGGFKPVDLRILALSLKTNFEKLFSVTFSVKQNSSFLVKTKEQFEKRNWASLVILFQKVIEKAYEKLAKEEEDNEEEEVKDVPVSKKSKKRKNKAASDEPSKKVQKTERQRTLRQFWEKFSVSVERFNTQQNLVKNSFAFSFVEGTLVKALKEGHWILLDEINLASTETLERLSSLLDGEEGTLFITEKGDTEPVKRHPEFRLFACMNPPTDIGKKNLPPAMRNRFTEFYVNELTDADDLKIVVSKYLEKHQIANPPTDAIVSFYLEAKAQSEVNLSDGAGHKPHYSLRTLSRSLEYVSVVLPIYGLERALYEGFCMGFLTLLSRSSFSVMEEIIRKYLCKKSKESLASVPRCPGDGYVQFEHFWLKTGQFTVQDDPYFIITPSVQTHLKNLARALKTNKYPILLQGPTSAGKTSMVSYLAKRTGHRFVRINNHESTDLQEYFGTYITNSDGKLVFQEGILVEAVRNGYWIVLDELNLAPSDILEALNRLLDDNRELFIPETQEIIKPHPHFQLFATQNPPGLYGGRKVLSRAFRNRFLEFHVDDIPGDELKIILQRRCGISARLADRMVNVMKSLQTHRQSSKIFAGKGGFITPRDLFRWAERVTTLNNAYKEKQEIAEEGFMLLAERLRRDDEKVIVKETLEKCMGVTLDIDKMYDCEESEEFKSIQMNSDAKIVWTKTMRRLFTLVGKCLKYKEPVLLVGETGCGKTTICQIYSEILKNHLHILNCHQHTETSDFLGSLRPVRGRDTLLVKIKNLIIQFAEEYKKIIKIDLAVPDMTEDLGDAIKSLEKVCNKIVKKRQAEESSDDDFAERPLLELQLKIRTMYQEWKSLFVWYDGPLVEAMKNGDLFLIDEISLAEDAVLERLNSVLEPSRELVLPEKGSENIEEISAVESFRVMATMNPGGDFGKKELSPALRNRFTEIYVPTLSVKEDLALIIGNRLSKKVIHFNVKMVDFVNFFKSKKSKRILSIRDVISWIEFLNLAVDKLNLNPYESYVHGAEVVILEGVGIGSDILEKTRMSLRSDSLQFLIGQFENETSADEIEHLKNQFLKEKTSYSLKASTNENTFGFYPFFIDHGPTSIPKSLHYSLNAPTTSKNVMKVLRALQLRKPLLLEGSPGVGKTSLIQAIAKASGHNVVRINLSEQTDMMDLLGSDLPVEGGAGGQFRWSDGIFLSALKAGDWVLLDELNLASQSVLEGLNSVLDHRAEIYIPELNRTFSCPKSFRIFGAQNPLQQGGGRKGLPKSFLNRFTQVYVEQMQSEDLLFIAMMMYGDIGEDNLRKMINFNELMYEDSMINYKFARKGSPWEFNLRDVFRWCELLLSENMKSGKYDPSRFVDCVYRQRMRTEEDRLYISKLYEKVFGEAYVCDVNPSYTITPHSVQIGQSEVSTNASLSENDKNNHATISGNISYNLLHSFLNPLENILKCIQMNYMCILTGNSGSGKTSLIRLAAQMTGNVLNEFSMSSSTDTVELLGTFEQVDPLQKQRHVAMRAKTKLDDLARSLCTNNKAVDRIQQLYNDWATLEETLKSPATTRDDRLRTLELVRTVVRSIYESADELEQSAESELDHCISELNQVEKLINDGVKGRFAWNDGTLIRSMEAGHWILIDNVNFCNPTVLDRLNGLLEPNGVLVVNERGLVDGEIKVVKPHHHFRIFMVMDPKYGEISRAMRNRGIEISIVPTRIPSQDAFTLLSSVGIQSPLVINKIMTLHNEFLDKVRTTEEDRPTLRDLIRCAEIFLAEASRGLPIEQALIVSIDSTYIRNKCLQPHQKEMAVLLSSTIVANDNLSMDESILPSAFLSQNSFCVNNAEYRSVLRQGALLYYTAKKLLALKLQNQLQGKQKISLASVAANLNWPSLITELPSSFVQKLVDPSINSIDVDAEFVKSAVSTMISQFGHAAEFFVSRTPVDLAPLRMIWLDRLMYLCQGEPDLTRIIEKTKFMITKRSDSRLAKDISKRLTKSVLPNINEQALIDVLAQQPLDLRLNKQLYQKLKYSGLYGTLSDSLFDRVSMLTKVISRKYEEDMIYNNSTDSLIRKSKNYNSQKKKGKLSDTDLVQFLFPLIQAADQLIDSIINDDQEQILLESVESLFQTRIRIWQYLANSTVLTEEFLIYWHWFEKSLAAMSMDKCSNKSTINFYNHLSNIMLEVNERCTKLFDSLSRKNYLWKYGGHPKNLSSTELIMLKNDIETFIQTHDIDNKPDIKVMLVKAVCTINWLNEQKNSNAAQLGNSLSDLMATLESTYKLKENREASHLREQKEFELEEIFDFIFNNCKEDDDEDRVRSSSLSKHTTKELLPLYEYNSVAEETSILAMITHFIVQLRKRQLFTDIPSFNNSVRELLAKIKNLISYVFEKTPRNPLDMAPYQTFVWTLESININKQSSSHEIDEVYVKLAPLHAVLHDMWAKWNARLWDNGYNRVEQFESNTDGATPEQLEGPNRLFQDINSVRILSILRDWQSVPIRARYTKIDQLKHIVDFMCTSTDQEDISNSDWIHVINTFTDTLLCFKKSFSNDDALKLENTLNEILTCSSLVETLGSLISNSSDSRLRANMNTVVEIAKLLELRHDISQNQNVLRARIWVLVGVLRLKLVIPAQSLDPARKYSVAIDLLTPDYEEVTAKIDMFTRIERFITGSSMNLDTEKMNIQLATLKEAIDRIEDKVVVRPVTQPFKMLYKDMKDFVDALVTSKIDTLLKPILSLPEHDDPTNLVTDVLVKEDMIQNNMSSVTRNLLNSYSSYTDVLVPFTTSVYQIKYGLRLLSYFGTLEHSEVESNQISTITRDIVRFPSSNDLSMLQANLSIVNTALTLGLRSSRKYERYQTLIEVVRVLMAKIHLHAMHHQYVSREVLASIDLVFSAYSALFKLIDDETKQYEKEQEELYKYKEQTTVIETDEDILAKEIEQMFPTYLDHYDQFLKKDETSSVVAPEKPDNKELKKLNQVLYDAQEIIRLVNIHREVYTKISQADRNDNKADLNSIRTQLFTDSMKVAGKLISSTNASSSMSESGLLPFILYGSQAISEMTEKLNIQAKPADVSVFDIYSDSNIPEVSLAFNTLLPMVQRFNELLKKYEKHPTLVQMTNICERILDLSVSTPIIKVLTGLEVLLMKANEWQEYLTSPAGSIKEQILKLTTLIIRWRKMELDNWRSVLVSKRKETRTKAVKWWFRFYRMINMSSYTNPDELPSDEELQKAATSFLAICEDYIRTASVGEFTDRLELLPNFFIQLTAEIESQFTTTSLPVSLKQKFLNILFNMHRFYAQFKNAIENQIENDVKPIEEKLKNFVKLMKWEDVNVDGLRQSTSKSRRQLGKFSKGFNEILVKPARDIWDKYDPQAVAAVAEKDSATAKRKKNKNKKKKRVRKNKKVEEVVVPALSDELEKLATVFRTKSVEEAAQVGTYLLQGQKSLNLKEDDLISGEKLAMVDSKIEHNLTKYVLQNHKVMNECDMTIDHLEDLSTTVINRMKDLQKPGALTMIKKRALNDLLKELKTIGISSLIAKVKQQTTTQLIFEQSRVALNQSSKCQETEALWLKSDDYYYKSIYGLQHLRHTYDTEPSEDLNDKEKRQMVGFSENLFHYAMKQRAALAALQTEQNQLGVSIGVFNDLRNAANQTNLMKTSVLPPQRYAKQWLVKQQDFFSRFAELLSELSILFQNLTTSSIERSSAAKTLGTLHDLIITKKKVLDEVSVERAETIFTSVHLSMISNNFSQMPDIQNLVTQLETESPEIVGRCKDLRSLVEEGSKLAVEFAQTPKEQSTKKIDLADKFKQTCADLVTSIQLSAQRLIKQFQTEEETLDEIVANKDPEENVNEDGDGESLFLNEYKENSVARLNTLFESSFNVLSKGLRDVNQKIAQLHSLLEQASNQPDTAKQRQINNSIVIIIGRIQPIMRKLQDKIDLFKYPFLSFHKAITKLEFILLSIFCTLFREGFCATEEGEGEGEGKSGQIDFSQGTGMDEGEGINDVTDQIENEDQIMDAKDLQKEDQPKKQPKENDDAVEVETDFESKLEDVDQQEKEDNEEEEEEEEDEMDKDMGEIDDNDPNKETLDKKLWDENDEDDNDDREDENNDGSNANEKQETELQAKEEEREGPEDSKQKKEPPQVDTNQENEEVEQEEYQDIVSEDQMRDENEEKEDEGQPEDKEFELPSQMDLDEGDEGDDDSDDGEQEENDSEEEGENADQAPDALPAHREEDVEEIETEDAVNEENVQQDDIMEDENNDDNQPGLDPSTNDETNQTKEEEEEDEKMGDDEEEEEKDNPRVDTEEEEAFQEDLKETPFGVQHTAGKASEIKDDEPEEEREEKKNNQAEEESGKDTNKSESGESFDQGSDNKKEKKENKSDAAQFDPNPYRSLGDALKEWKEKLNMVDKKEDSEENGNDNQNEEDDFEFADKDQEQKENDMQVLAPATQEQADAFPELENRDDDNESSDDESEQSKDIKNKDQMSDSEDEADEQNSKNSGKAVMRFEQKNNEDEDDEMNDEEMVDAEPEIKKEFNVEEGEKKPSSIHVSTGQHAEQDLDVELDSIAEEQNLSMEDIQKMREELDIMLSEWRNDQDKVEKSKDAWKRFDMITNHLSQELCEQLRLILEPTLATKLKGDYKTGKRINMKKVIPYIASQFRKDKIWLRRTKPNKRQYQVLLAIDDSKSMGDNHAGQMACEAVTLISKAMSQLEVGQLAVVSFGEKVNLLHPFDRPFSDEAGSELLAQFTFNQNQTQIYKFMQDAVSMLDAYKSFELVNNTEQVQLAFIISDGRMLDRESIVKMVRQAQEKRQLFVFILIDNPNPKDSILELKSVSYPNGKLTVTSYIDQFPFPYYIILRDIQSLPEILADALRQFFELLAVQNDQE